MRRERWHRTWLSILLLSSAFILNGCARNPTSSLFQDGRLFVLVDLDSEFFSVLSIRADVEGFDPVLVKVYDFERGNDRDIAVLGAQDALNWSKVQGEPIDIIGHVIKGGSEVRVHVAPSTALESATLPPFKLDGNVIVQIFILDPDDPGAKTLQIRRSSFGSTL
jgi:hypothetical protein